MTLAAVSLADVAVVRSVPADAEALGVPVGSSGSVPRSIGLTRAALGAHGFDGEVGQTLIVPSRDAPTVVAVGVGDTPSVPDLRNAAAAFARATAERSRVATGLATAGEHPAAEAAAAVTEGVLLARYRYHGSKTSDAPTALERLDLVVPAKSSAAADAGAARGRVTARAGVLARDLANAPANLLNARDIAALAVDLAGDHGLEVEVFDADRLRVMGCGGILGVNAGSAEPPRMVKLTYTPDDPQAHVCLVGKGVMYDSGGISLKPTNAMHVMMKMDMSGAGAVLAAMTTLAELGCRNRVSAWLMCTDNMPSGSALKLSDVLTIRNGKTVEIHNTDAEGRLILADGLSLAAEETPDVIVDIATLTGAALAALGQEYAAVVGTDQGVVDSLLAASGRTDEPLWQMPLARDRYRKLLDSNVADMRNIGGPYAGAITAAIFLSEFVGDVPWAHLDIAGPMNAESDTAWRSKGATGFGARTLADFACSFTTA